MSFILALAILVHTNEAEYKVEIISTEVNSTHLELLNAYSECVTVFHNIWSQRLTQVAVNQTCLIIFQNVVRMIAVHSDVYENVEQENETLSLVHFLY